MGHPRDFRHDSGGGGDAGYDPSGGGGGGHSAHFDHLPDTFHAEFITQVTGYEPDSCLDFVIYCKHLRNFV